MNVHRRSILCSALGAALLLPLGASAQAAYPGKVIRVDIKAE